MERTRQDRGVYRLPRVIEARLAESCRGLRNAEAVMKLAVFLARWHTSPKNLGRSFPVDRLALAAHTELDLTASQVRGALAVLEREGFVARQVMPGSPYRRTEWGLRRKAAQWRIGAAFEVLFEKANAAARGKRETAARRTVARPAPVPVPVVAKKETPAEAVFLGEQNLDGLLPGLKASFELMKRLGKF